MELKLISSKQDSIEVEIIGENETLLVPLQEKLLENENVEDVRYMIGHPMIDNPRIFVRVKKGKPKNVLKKAAKEVAGDYEAFELQLKKALKKFK